MTGRHRSGKNSERSEGTGSPFRGVGRNRDREEGLEGIGRECMCTSVHRGTHIRVQN